ncbi:hypothetical protein ACJQWK_10854 [Exserohilum turcicum]
MSVLSASERPSGDSDRWTASSNTYIARSSGTYTDNDNGDRASYPRRSQDSRPATGAANGIASADADAPMAVEPPTAADDFAPRKQRARRSGGFLLDSTFPSGPRQRYADDAKGKRSPRHHGTQERSGRNERSHRARLSPANAPVADEGQRDERGPAPGASRIDFAPPQEQNSNGLHVDRARTSAHDMQSAPRDRDGLPRTQPPPRQAIDPNQLVHMALNLSESRRRHMSTGQLLASQPRVASGSQREGSFANYGAGGSLKQYLNEQRRASRNMSPMGGSSNSPSQHISNSMQRSGSVAFPGSQTINPSASTLARVNKARAYIELRMEYLRLLEFVPPLKPDASAPGNFIVSSSNMPGSPQAHLTRVPSYAGKQHDLGRPYNPLQYLRNRRTRARERVVLEHPPEEFEDVEEVRDWVDRVQEHAKYAGYRRDDAVQLPKFHNDHEVDTPSSKPARAYKGWFFTPQELLADAHWLEQGDNKRLLENRFGQPVFPPKEAQPRNSTQTRTSKDYPDKRRKSWGDGLPGIALDPTTGDESDRGSERGRKRRLLPTLRPDSPKARKHSRRGSRLRTHDDVDTSGSESDTKRRKTRVATDPEQNTGPLALLLEQQAKQSQVKSPAASPNTPDKWGRNGDIAFDDKPARDSLDVPQLTNGFAYVKDHGTFKLPQKPRKTISLSADDADPRSSYENLDSTGPNTPNTKPFPRISTEFSPPQSRSSSQTRKPKRHKFNQIFHSHDHSEDSQHEWRPDSSGTDRKGKSNQASGDTSDEKNIGSAILAAPGAVRNLLGHRKNDSVSSLASPDKTRRKETQEPQSAVTRFFKGVRNEGTKVGDIIFRRDRADDSDSDTMSDNSVEFDDDNDSTRAKHGKRKAMKRTITSGSRTSFNDERSYLDLPSFRPVHASEDKGSGNEHHISRQARERKGSRSPRIDRLLPPRMDLSAISNNSSQVSLSLVPTQDREIINKALAHPGVIAGGLPPTGLRNSQLSSRQRSSSRPGLSGRHWSITDKDDHDRKNKADVITQADIARVRALFVCSGVKAKEIVRRSQASRDPPSEFLARAAALTKTKLYPVPRKQEHVLAARILVKDLEASTKALQSALEGFRNKAIQQLSSQVSLLQSTVDSDLMPRILEAGDKAVRVTSEVSGQGSLQVKQITDEIDGMIRARKRRMKWMGGFGWMLVEWALVGLMWCLWLTVVLVGSVKRVFGVGWSVVRWLLWL